LIEKVATIKFGFVQVMSGRPLSILKMVYMMDGHDFGFDKCSQHFYTSDDPGITTLYK